MDATIARFGRHEALFLALYRPSGLGSALVHGGAVGGKGLARQTLLLGGPGIRGAESAGTDDPRYPGNEEHDCDEGERLLFGWSWHGRQSVLGGENAVIEIARAGAKALVSSP
jgi:hypothetical protein